MTNRTDPRVAQKQRETIGNKIAAARAASGMNQTQLAERLGVTLSQYSKWESGRHMPSIGWLARIAVELDVNPGDLVGGLREWKPLVP